MRRAMQYMVLVALVAGGLTLGGCYGGGGGDADADSNNDEPEPAKTAPADEN